MEQDKKNQFLSAYEVYADALFRHCYFRFFDRELAKDLVQETFCRTWAYLSKGKEIKNIRPFLYQVLRNVVADEIRKKMNKDHMSLDKLAEQGFSFGDKSGPDIEQQIIAKNIMKTLENLEEPYREAVQMRFIDDLPPKDMAIILGVSENVASMRIHRGIDKLKKINAVNNLKMI